MVIVMILSVLLILICGIRVIESIDSKRNNPVDFISLIGAIVFSFLAGVFVILHASDNLSELRDEIKQPTAIDVYRGRTTLQITYEDSVAVDSTVIFKDKKR